MHLVGTLTKSGGVLGKGSGAILSSAFSSYVPGDSLSTVYLLMKNKPVYSFFTFIMMPQGGQALSE